jgi:4-carboxymuconolactone decarboxylase
MATIADIERHLTPALRAQRQEMLDKRGLPTLGFYEQLMAYPELFERLQALGTFVRFESVLPPRVREAEILMAAVEQRSAFEWQTHATTAAAAGVEPALCRAIGAGEPLPSFGDALEDVRAAVRCVVRADVVPQDVFDRLASAFTVPGAVEVVVVASMYRMFASLGAAFESRMPEGTPPPPWEPR